MKTANSILKLAVSACLSVFVFSFVEVCAETVEYNGYSLRLKADRNGSLYKSGDIARFVLTASKGRQAGKRNKTRRFDYKRLRSDWQKLCRRNKRRRIFGVGDIV